MADQIDLTIRSLPFQTLSFLNTQGELADGYSSSITNEQLIKGYRTLLVTRMVDERMVTLQRQGTISFALTSAGEEACAVASAAALENDDWLYPQYRESGIMFWRGFSIIQYVHHMFSDANDLTLGRQMPNHFGSKFLNVVPVSSPIGTKIPHAAGAAYAMKLKKLRSITVCYFGEGATSEGDFHVGVNFAAVRKSPVIFFCRNNGYAISTPAARQFASEGIAPKAVGYGIAAIRIDGNDYFAVHDAVKKAREYCLNGNGPLLIEAMTYRIGAHSTSDDPSLYRSEGEVENWKQACPILRLKRYLMKNNLWDDQKEEKLLGEITEEINQAIEFAKKTPLPPKHSLIENVYFEIPQSLQNQYDELNESGQSEGLSCPS